MKSPFRILFAWSPPRMPRVPRFAASIIPATLDATRSRVLMDASRNGSASWPARYYGPLALSPATLRSFRSKEAREELEDALDLNTSRAPGSRRPKPRRWPR